MVWSTSVEVSAQVKELSRLKYMLEEKRENLFIMKESSLGFVLLCYNILIDL
jgi:hypothetical protein